MNINEVHWNFSDNGTKEPAKSRFWNFYNFWTAWNFLMRFSLLCSGEWALSFYMCVFIYIGVSLILHADVSNIIDIACHWSFFPILPVLATFWITETPNFFHFPTPIFAEPVPVELMFTHSTLITGLKHAIRPYFGIVWMLYYNI